MSYGELSAPKIVPINIVKVYEILQGNTTKKIMVKKIFEDVGKITKNVAGGVINRTLARLTGAGIQTDSRVVKARARWTVKGSQKIGV